MAQPSKSSLKIRTVIKVDLRGLKDIRRKLKNGTQQLQVGFFDGKMHPTWTPYTYAEIAMMNEYGQPHVPARRMFRWTWAVNKDAFTRELSEVVRDMFTSKKTIRQGLFNMGKRKVRLLSGVINSNPFVDNAPFTVMEKGRNSPLSWTGALEKAVQFRTIKNPKPQP